MKLRRLMYYTTSAMVVVIFFSSNSYGRKTSCSYPEPDPYGPIYLPIYDELDDETLKSLQKCPVKQEFVRETQCTINENGNCELSGAILKDTILTLRKSPYEVVGDFQVPPGLKLRIQPGVKVYFNEDSRILVQGAIKAVGTETKKILFTSVTGGTLSRGTMIEFYNTNLYNQLLEYIIFSYGSKTLFLNDNPIDQATQNIGTLRSNHLEFINNVKNVDSNNNIVLNNMRATEGSMKIYAWGLTTFISIDHAILTNVQFYINNTLKIENSTLNNVGYEGLRTDTKLHSNVYY